MSAMSFTCGKLLQCYVRKYGEHVDFETFLGGSFRILQCGLPGLEIGDHPQE
jgi:hypothetical protein